MAGNLIAASAPNVLFPGVWQYIEVLYSPNSSGGSLQIKIDGAVVINVTGNVMTAGNPAAVNYMSFTNTAPNNVTLIDDLYICDQTGPAPFNTYLGDVVVHAAFPVSDASPNQWTQAGGGVGHFTAIDDNPGPDDDASYLFSNTAGQQELFDISTFPPDIIDVLAVGVNIRARKDTAGYAFYMANLVVASTEGDIGPIVASQAYETSQSIYELAPGGGSWTTSAAQNCKIGFSIPT